MARKGRTYLFFGGGQRHGYRARKAKSELTKNRGAMRGKRRIVFLAFLVTFFLWPKSAFCDELSELKEQLKTIQTEMASVYERIGKLETQQVKQRKDNLWIPRRKMDFIRIGGGVEIEYTDGQSESNHPGGTTGVSEPHFQIDKVDLRFDTKIVKHLNFKSKISFSGNDNDIEIRDTYLELMKLPLESYVQIGNNVVFFRPERITEGYPLGGTAFWRKRDLGIWYGGAFKPLYWRFSLTNGLELDDKDFGETAGSSDLQQIIADDSRNDDLNQNKEIGAGLGVNQRLGRFGAVDLLGFLTRGRLTSEDLLFLQDPANLPEYGRETKRTKMRYGLNFDYTVGGFNLSAQGIRALDGKMRRFAWYIQPSYKFEINQKYLHAIRPLFRYSTYDTNMASSRTAGLTWDRQQYVLALILSIRSNLDWKWEYYVNREQTGGDHVRNDEWLSQLEYKF